MSNNKQKSDLKLSNQRLLQQKRLELTSDDLFCRQGFGVVPAGKIIGVSPKTMWRLIKDGAIGFRRIGKRVIISGKHIDEYLASCEIPAGEGKRLASNILKGRRAG